MPDKTGHRKIGVRESYIQGKIGTEANKRNSVTSSSIESSTLMTQNSVEQMLSEVMNQCMKRWIYSGRPPNSKTKTRLFSRYG